MVALPLVAEPPAPSPFRKLYRKVSDRPGATHRAVTALAGPAGPGRATVGARLRRTGGRREAGSRRDGDIAARTADRLVGAADTRATTAAARTIRPRDYRRRKSDDEDRDREERHPSFHALDPFEVPGEFQGHLSMYSLNLHTSLNVRLNVPA